MASSAWLPAACGRRRSAGRHPAVVVAVDADRPGALVAGARRGAGSPPRAPRRPRGPWSAGPAGATRSASPREPKLANMWTNSTPVTPGTDHHQVLGHRRRRIGVACGQHPIAVGLRPVGDARPAAGGDHDRVGLEGAARPSSVSATTVWSSTRRPVPRTSSTPWLSSSWRPERSRRSMIDVDPCPQRDQVDRRRLGDAEAHPVGAVDLRRARRRWRSSPSTARSPTDSRRRRRCHARSG